MIKRRYRTLLWIALTALCSFPFFYPLVVISQTESSFYPSTFTPVNATRHVSGSVSDLQVNDGVGMIFQSYPSSFSPKSLFMQQETITIASTEYYSISDIIDSAGTVLFAPLSSSGRSLLGKFIYPLAGVESIPSSTWEIYYRSQLSNRSEQIFLGSPSWIQTPVWNNPENAYLSDNGYAYSSNQGQAQVYGNYGFDLPPTANITKVEVGCEAYTTGDEGISIDLSLNGGVNWFSAYGSPSLQGSDSDIVNWVDLTTTVNWTASALSDSNLKCRVQVVKVGAVTDNVFLDWLPMRVTYVNPIPSARMDVDILIRKSDGAIRQTVAVDVANSDFLSETVQTLAGTYDWSAYSVVDETDYLEIDYYVDVIGTDPNIIANLTIDDVALVPADQTRVGNILFPSEYAVEVELSGNSNAGNWSELVWKTGTSWTTGEVYVTLQLYDYSQDTYPTSGDGQVVFTSSSVSNTNEIKTQTITTNPTRFRDQSGNWKMRINGVKSDISPFSLKLDSMTYQATPIVPTDITVPDVHHDIAVLDVTYSPTNIHIGDIVEINVTVKNEGGAPDSFNVTCSCENNEIARQVVTNLMSNESIVLTFNWNTTGTAPGAYTLKAMADAVPTEEDTTNNIFIYAGIVTLLSAEDNELSPPLWNWTWGLLSVPLLVLFSAAGIVWKKRKNKLKSVGIEFLNEITEGGIPDSFSVMIVGDSNSGKSTLFQELVHAFLKMEKPCIYVAYEGFPDEIRQSMKKLQLEVSSYESQGKLLFIDCFSSNAKVQSKEKYFLDQPFSLIDLGISISKATKETGNGVKVFIDSMVPLLTQLDPEMIQDFLQDRIARLKGVKGNLIFTLNKESVDPALMSNWEEIVDCVIELDADSAKRKIARKLRIKKMRGRDSSDKWVQFETNSEKGIVFLI
jgi:KaiC/GvpD/RAD55 family RecA-like ATPase